eukprot:5537619-Pleurochrysis_carterae.AAC.1
MGSPSPCASWGPTVLMEGALATRSSSLPLHNQKLQTHCKRTRSTFQGTQLHSPTLRTTAERFCPKHYSQLAVSVQGSRLSEQLNSSKPLDDSL